MRILIISSENLYSKSSCLAYDQYLALKSSGHDVNILTIFDESGNSDIISVYDDASFVKNRLNATFIKKIKDFCVSLFNRIKYPKGRPIGKQYYFFYREEYNPPVPIDLVLSKIQKSYDLVIITFWQGLLSAQTVLEISKKTMAPIFFLAVDMSPMTGGCHYFWDCRKFEDGCGSCPGIKSNDPHDFTEYNMLYRARVFSEIKCVFIANKYTNKFARKSMALRTTPIVDGYVVVNENHFCPHPKQVARKHFNIEPDDKYIFLAGAQSLIDPRKGMDKLIESLNIFYDETDVVSRDKIIVLLAGKEIDSVRKNIRFDTIDLGLLDIKDLPMAYSACDVFLSPSLLDAGPMMVNQSLSCGTPVIAFDVGVASELIISMKTGYCASYGNVKDFAKGMKLFYKLDSQLKDEISLNCRSIALKTSSFKSFSNKIIDSFNTLV